MAYVIAEPCIGAKNNSCFSSVRLRSGAAISCPSADVRFWMFQAFERPPAAGLSPAHAI
jgi:hypothetical protein